MQKKVMTLVLLGCMLLVGSQPAMAANPWKQMKKVLSITDRREAIRTAVMLAQKGDVILIAGKGHEDYQEIKGVKHHFDDKEVVRDAFGM